MIVMRFFGTLVLALLLVACRGADDGHGGDGHGHDAAGGHVDDDAAAIGEHGGRRLQADGFAVELALVESGSSAKFQAWRYRDGKPLPATGGDVVVTLTRLGGHVETHRLVARVDGSLRADADVREPHSFDVAVAATIDDSTLQWRYENHEGRTRIAPAIAEESGIRVAPAAPGTIADEHEVQGLLTPIDGRVATLTARYPGPVRRLSANVGDRVRAGQALAMIESNLSLTSYTISSPIAGVVLSRNASVGGVAGEGAVLFEIADLSSLWVDLHVFGADANHIRPGGSVVVTRFDDGATARSTLERVLPGTATASQSTVARATLDNVDGRWRPGAAVKARITVGQRDAAIVVPQSALQRLGDRDVVFIRVDDVYEARPVQLGERDAQQVEVLSGLKPGDAVVVGQSYLVKADIEKSGASHEH